MEVLRNINNFSIELYTYLCKENILLSAHTHKSQKWIELT